MTPPTLNAILRATADRYGVTVGELKGHNHHKSLAHVRWTAFYLARTLTVRSSSLIGRIYGRDHSSILFGVKRMKERLTVCENTREHVTTIIKWLSTPHYTPREHVACREIADGLAMFGVYRYRFLPKSPWRGLDGKGRDPVTGVRL